MPLWPNSEDGLIAQSHAGPTMEHFATAENISTVAKCLPKECAVLHHHVGIQIGLDCNSFKQQPSMERPSSTDSLVNVSDPYGHAGLYLEVPKLLSIGTYLEKRFHFTNILFCSM